MGSERRTAERLSLDVHLDDLQSEQEACARTLAKAQTDVGRLDSRLEVELDLAAIAGRLVNHIRELKHSTGEQRTMLRALREEMRILRRRVDLQKK